jgi:hypothetical protein
MEVQLRMEVAKKTNVNAALFIHNISFWLKKNKSNEKHYHDGHYWTYNTYKAFEELFPCWTIKSIRTIVKNLEDSKILISTSKYNNKNYDNTKWYTLDKKFLKEYYPDFNIYPDENQQTSKPETSKPVNQKPDNKDLITKLVNQFIDNIKTLDRKVNITPTTIKNWSDSMRLLIDEDGRTYEEIKHVMKFVINNDFWKSNILSVPKLRKQFTTLIIQSKYKPEAKPVSFNSKKPVNQNQPVTIVKPEGMTMKEYKQTEEYKKIYGGAQND